MPGGGRRAAKASNWWLSKLYVTIKVWSGDHKSSDHASSWQLLSEPWYVLSRPVVTQTGKFSCQEGLSQVQPCPVPFVMALITGSDNLSSNWELTVTVVEV